MKNTPMGEGMGGGFRQIWCVLPRTVDASVHQRANLKAHAEELTIGNIIQTKQLHKICYKLIG